MASKPPVTSVAVEHAGKRYPMSKLSELLRTLPHDEKYDLVVHLSDGSKGYPGRSDDDMIEVTDDAVYL
jgi:hypothetical protein